MLVPISSIKRGLKARVKAINLEHGLKKKIMEMGIISNSELKLMDRRHSGYVVVETNSYKLAFDDFIARNIVVELLR